MGKRGGEEMEVSHHLFVDYILMWFGTASRLKINLENSVFLLLE